MGIDELGRRKCGYLEKATFDPVQILCLRKKPAI
jgi:hypothetical protein